MVADTRVRETFQPVEKLLESCGNGVVCEISYGLYLKSSWHGRCSWSM
jgi:hypothetical protein